MTTLDWMAELGKVGLSSGLLIGVLACASRLTARYGASPETARKFIHLCLGSYCLTFPWLFRDALGVALTGAAACGVFFLARHARTDWLGRGLHAVSRRSFGELWFALSVVVLFCAFEARRAQPTDYAPELLFLAPIAILTFSDAAAALIGARVGRMRFRIGDAQKSLEGCAAFAGSAFLITLAVLILGASLSVPAAIAVAASVAMVGLVLEAASGGGSDNLVVPVGVACVLFLALEPGLSSTLAVATVTAGAPLALAFAAGRSPWSPPFPRLSDRSLAMS